MSVADAVNVSVAALAMSSVPIFLRTSLMVPIGVAFALIVKVMLLGLSWSIAAGGGPGGDLGLGDLDLLFLRLVVLSEDNPKLKHY